MAVPTFSVLALTGAQWILLVAFAFPVVILWGYAIVNLVARHDLGAGGTFLWLVGIVALPVVGAVLYFMLRPAPQEQNRRAQARRRKH